jgi:hypothetical protein
MSSIWNTYRKHIGQLQTVIDVLIWYTKTMTSWGWVNANRNPGVKNRGSFGCVYKIWGMVQ